MLSSPYVRCMETVVPLGGVRRIPIEPVDALTEGASLEDALTLVRKHASRRGAVQPRRRHPDAARALRGPGVDLGTDPEWPKGCTWVLEIDGAQDVVAATYLARLRPSKTPFGGAPARPAAPGCRPSRSFPDSDGNDTTCRSTDARMASE